MSIDIQARKIFEENPCNQDDLNSYWDAMSLQHKAPYIKMAQERNSWHEQAITNYNRKKENLEKTLSANRR